MDWYLMEYNCDDKWGLLFTEPQKAAAAILAAPLL